DVLRCDDTTALPGTARAPRMQLPLIPEARTQSVHATLDTSTLHSSLPLGPNNRLTGTFSWINPYRRPFFLIKCCHRVLSRIFSVLITYISREFTRENEN